MKTAIRIAACFLACASPLAATQTPSRDAAAIVPAPSGTAGLAGIVRDPDNKPVRRATVSISGDMRLNRVIITDDEGRFAFARLPAGRFTITATKAGHPPMSLGAKRPFRTGSGLMLAEGQQVNGILLTLPRGAVLAGTVYDERGEPMQGTPVMAWEVRTSLAGERTLDFPATGGDSVTTDDRGAYRIFGLPPGEYTVGTAWFYHGSGAELRVPTDAEIRAAFLAVAQPAPALSASSRSPSPAPLPPRYDYAPVFHPGTVDPMVASTLTLAAGEERIGIDLQMQLRQMSRVEGVVLGLDGRGAVARLELARRSPVTALNSTTVWGSNPDGTFTSSSVSPGDYTIIALVAAGSNQQALWASAEVTISGADPAPVQLSLQPALTLPGRIIFDSGVLRPPAFQNVRVGATSLLRGAAGSGTGVVDASGQFSLTGLTPGRYRFTASVPNAAAVGAPAWTVRSVTYGDRDVTDLPIEITAGDPAPVTVTFTDRVSELSGRLVTPSGQPAPDYFVIVLPADRKYWLPLSRRIVSARPDSNGRYIFRGLPAGEYLLAATTDLVTQDLQNLNALALLAAQAAPIGVVHGEKTTVDLRVGG